MRIEKIHPETLLQLMVEVLSTASSFVYISGTQPFLMQFRDKEYYVYVKNLSSAYFKDRPDTTRAQLPVRTEFEEIIKSPRTFVFFGYDQKNDVLVCWNFHNVKTRLNEKRSVSFYSRQFFQDEVSLGTFSRKRLKNGDEPILFKRRNLLEFFNQIETFFKASDDKTQSSVFENSELQNLDDYNNQHLSNGKLLKIVDEKLLEQLKPLIETRRTLQALKLAADFYKGQYSAMKLADWNKLIKEINTT